MRDGGIEDTVEGAKPVSKKEGKEMCKKLSCDKYVEVSAKANKGIDELFNSVVDLIYKKRHPNADDEGADAAAAAASAPKPAEEKAAGDKKAEGGKDKKGKKGKKDKGGCVLQ